LTETLTAIGAAEEALVLAAARGDREAFASLYEAHMPRVYRYLYARLGSSSDAEDVTAEVFIKAMRGLPSYQAKGAPFAAWLLRIAHNEMVNHVKKRARRGEVQLEGHDLPSRDPAEIAINSAAAGEVRQAMESLTNLQREVVTLRFASELSVAETAEAMGRSIQAVKFLQHSALRALQRAMQRRGDRR
jgi:RNA polymerase sigma-70 factor, ECF subfamily